MRWATSGTRCSRRPTTCGPTIAHWLGGWRCSARNEGARRQRAAELSFESRGITFAVNQGPEGVEKIMPFDLVPRLVQAEEWRQIETGLEQRIRALNLFLDDIYHDAAHPQ